MRKIIMALSLTAVAAPVTPVLADPPPWAPAHGRRAKEYQYRGDYYRGPVWQGRDGRMYCRRSNGTTGLIVGAAAGALIGRAVDGGRNRTTGTIVGAAAGALLGREVDRGARCR
jgi:hypothetical protein